MTETTSAAETIQSDHEHQTPSLFELLGGFLRLGLTAFGGPAMIPYVRRMALEQKKWIDADSFMDGVALCQMIPGATVMQVAAFIGLKTRGVPGAMVSYLGFIFPAGVLMLTLSCAYARTHELPAVLSVFSGLQTVVVAVVANATLSFGKTSLKRWKGALLALFAALLFWLTVNPVLIIALAAILGILLNGEPSTVRAHSPSAALKHTTIPLVLLLVVSSAGFGVLYVFRRELFHLALLMTKIDCIAFGGGFASVPLMFHEIVEARSWMDGPTFLNGIVLGQFTPGPIVITATFVGYMIHGLSGALIATVAVFLPSFLILIGIAPWFDRIRSSPLISRALGGILCSFVGLLFTVTVRFGLNVDRDWQHAILALAAFAALAFKVDILWVVLAGSAVSAFVF